MYVDARHIKIALILLAVLTAVAVFLMVLVLS